MARLIVGVFYLIWSTVIVHSTVRAQEAVTSGRDESDVFIDEEYDPNIAPKLRGLPAREAQVGQAYRFLPFAEDAEGNPLTFTVLNLPGWLNINNTTGEISGIPAAEHVGIATGITLIVSDGIDKTSLPPFTITVRADIELNKADTSLINLAQRYGLASQGSTKLNAQAEFAIDGNASTSNHTHCTAQQNWLQVKLPLGSVVHKVIVRNVKTGKHLLSGATLYFSAFPFTEGKHHAKHIATLEGFSEVQQVNLSAPRNARFVIVKAWEENCLHIAELEIWGNGQIIGSTKPPGTARDYLFHLPANSAVGSIVGTINLPESRPGITDSLMLHGHHSYFELDDQGRIILLQAIDHNAQQQFEMQLSDADFPDQRQTIQVKLGRGQGLWLQQWVDSPKDDLNTLLTRQPMSQRPKNTQALENWHDGFPGLGESGGVQRILGYLRPTRSGEYQFSIETDSADHAVELRLSSDAVAANLRTVLKMDGKVSSQPRVSSSFYLEAGKSYYLEVISQQGPADSRLVVKWAQKGASNFTAIPFTELYLDGLSVGLVRPIIGHNQFDYLVPPTMESGDELTHLAAVDLQGDSLQYTIENQVPFAVDQNGTITATDTLTPGGRYRLDVAVSDSVHTARVSLNVSVTEFNALENALISGDTTRLASAQLIDALVDAIDLRESRYQSILNALFEFDVNGEPTADSLNVINWNPTAYSVLIDPHVDSWLYPVLVSNHAEKEPESARGILAVAGENPVTGSRAAILSSNAMHDMAPISYPKGSGNVQMNRFIQNLLDWLMEEKLTHSEFKKIVVAHHTDTFYYKHDASIAAWLTLHYPNATLNPQDSCESTALAQCLQDADLLILGQDTGSKDNHGVPFNLARTFMAVSEAHNLGVPVLYVPNSHNPTELGRAMAGYFSVSLKDNFKTHERLLAHNPNGQKLSEVSPWYGLLDSALAMETTHWLDTARQFYCDISVNRSDCMRSSQQNFSQFELQDAQGRLLNWAKSILRGLDVTEQSLFESNSSFLEQKLFALLVRQSFGTADQPVAELKNH